jgi:putative addiction module component (TIGR02574 family)
VEAAEDVVLRLSAEERLHLIERLWESVVDERGDRLAITPEIETELDHRLAAHRRAPHESLSWSEIQRRVRDGE